MIITLTGTNEYQIESTLKKIIQDFKVDNDELAIEQIDASEADINSVKESLTSLSLFNPRRLVVLKRTNTNKDFIEQFENLSESIPDTTELVIADSELDKRSSYFKLLKSKTDYREFNDLNNNELINWVINEVKSKKGNIESTAARYLVESAGINQLRLSNEINKLLLYSNKITKESIDLLVEPTPQTTIFQLLDASFAGRDEEVLRIYNDQKKQKVEPGQVIALLTWQLHILAIMKVAGDRSNSQIASDAKINPFVVNKSKPIANKLELKKIEDILDKLIEIDLMIKSQSIDADMALIQLLLSISK